MKAFLTAAVSVWCLVGVANADITINVGRPDLLSLTPGQIIKIEV